MPGTTISRRDLVAALRDERRTLTARLQAIDAALEGFGYTESRSSLPRTREFRGRATIDEDELRTQVLEFFQRKPQGYRAMSREVAAAVGRPNTTVYNRLITLADEVGTLDRQRDRQSGIHFWLRQDDEPRREVEAS
jgi:hypothetical protein